MAESGSLGTQTTVEVLLEEYRAMYALAQFRLSALDRRVPLAGGALAAFLASAVVLPHSAQLVVLLVVPVALIWVLRTTITHACAFEDALRRIEQIERAVNAQVEADLLRFQSHHPSRGRATGGRTGSETIRSVLIASLLVLLACGWLARPVLAELPHGIEAFAAFLGVIGVVLVAQVVQYRKYRYAPEAADLSDGAECSETPSRESGP